MEASDFQEVAASHLPLACTVVGVARSADGSGGWTNTETAKETTVCGLAGGVLQGDISADVAAKLQGRNAYRYRLPIGTSAVVGDRLTVGARTFDLLSLIAAPDATLARGLCAEV